MLPCDDRPRARVVTLRIVDVRTLDDGPVNVRGGQVSHLLFAPEFGSRNVTVTWVRVSREVSRMSTPTAIASRST
jgi:hypothetical protein